MDALVNAILSFIVPGLGQAIEGYKQRGIILFVILLVLIGVLFYFNVDQIAQRIICGVYGLIAAYDAYRLYWFWVINNYSKTTFFWNLFDIS